jgi:predicted amidohydrolase
VSPAPETIRIGVCQLESDLAAPGHDACAANWERAVAAMDSVEGSADVDVWVFGEGYLNGYESGELLWTCAVHESESDPWVARLVEESARREAVIIMGATTHKGSFPGDLYNSAIVVDSGRYLGTYNKNHVAAFVFDGDRLGKERVFWSPGNELGVWETSAGVIGVEICYDVMFPEVARSLSLLGAELIVNVSAAVTSFEEFWDHVLPTRATENAVWYLHTSVVGEQRETTLFGGSRLFDPFGKLVAEAPRGSESVFTADVDRGRLLHARGTTHHFANRNPALYAPVTAGAGR